MAIELNNRTKILAGVVVLAAAGAAAWFFFLEDFLAEPPPKPAAAKAAPADAPKQAAADAPKQADAGKPAAGAPKQADAAKPAAAPANPGAKPIPTNPDRLIAEVIETSGMVPYLQTLAREAMLSAGAGNSAQKQGADPAEFARAVEVVNRVFEPAALTAEIAANLKTANYDVERMERFLELLRQPINAKMAAPEMRSVTPEATREHVEGQRKNPLPAARVKLIQTLDDVTQTSEIGADMGGTLAREMLDAMVDSMKKKAGKNAPAESQQTVGARLNAMRNQSRAQIRSTMYVMYRKASDEELSEYVKLLDTDTGRWGSELLASAIRPLVTVRGTALGREAAQLAAARPAAGKEAAAPQAAAAKEEPAPAAAQAPAKAPEAPSYRRPENIREAYSRYNDLITATVMRDGAAVKELLDSGKNPNARQSDGLTPLMVAASNSDAEIAAMLLAKGADPNLRAGSRSALSIAKSRGSAGAATVQLLERSGAK